MAMVKVACPSCGKGYKVPEEQLQRNAVCKACGREFALAEAQLTEEERETTPSGQPQWHVEVKGARSGPFEREKVLALLESGEITRNSLIWCEGMENWQPLKSVSEFASVVPRTGPFNAQERRESGAAAEPSVERGPLISPKHFGRAFQEAFDFQEGRIPPRLKEYIAEDERVILAFSLSSISCFLSILSACILPALWSLISLVVAAFAGVAVLVMAIGSGLLTLMLALLIYLSWKNTGFVLTDRRVLGRRGIFDVRWVFLTRTLINSVEVDTGLLDRLFGLEKVTIRALNGVINCRGVSADISRKLVRLITEEPANEPR